MARRQSRLVKQLNSALDAPLVDAFRPRTFADVVGQAEVCKVLRQFVLAGTARPTLLFVGPAGTGKTSTARILSAGLNCDSPQEGDPCGSCGSCRTVWERTSLSILE